MMRTITLAFCAGLLSLIASGCQPPAQETGEEMAADRDPAQVEADFEALRAEWETMANADDAAGVASLYAEDAVFIDASGVVYEGREAIQGYLEESFASATDLTIETTDMVMHGDMAAGYGSYSQTVTGPEGDMPVSGMWQTASMYQPDGSVRILLHLSMVPMEMEMMEMGMEPM